MLSHEAVIKQVYAALERDPRINLHAGHIEISFSDGTLVMEGEVANIAAKRLARKRAVAAAMNGITGVVDDMRVTPAGEHSDNEIRDSFCRFFLSEPALTDCSLYSHSKGERIALRQLPGKCEIEVAVEDGVVIMAGEMVSLAHKRLLGALAWWAPGSADVVNDVEVSPPDLDSDQEIAGAVHMVLEKDPLVDASQVRADAHRGVVTLRGYVRTDEEKRMAEADAWYVYGVEDVINEMEVRHAEPPRYSGGPSQSAYRKPPVGR